MEYRRTSLARIHKKQAGYHHIYATFAGSGLEPNPIYRGANGFMLERPFVWWDDERIEATVTRQFVASKLRPDEQLRLAEPLSFGDSLTNDTYMEWIEGKAKRIFLILLDLGVPDQIFGVIDDSWDDDDLPVPLNQVGRLALTLDKDDKMEEMFFYRQFTYLLRYIQKGDRLQYDDEEVVPLELAEKPRQAGAVAGLTKSHDDKVHLPGRPEEPFLCRKIPLGHSGACVPREEFLSGVEAMKAVDHIHLVSLWASYIHKSCGYLLLTPVNGSNLRALLSVTPQSIKILAKRDRRMLLLNWLHCLTNGLSFLHSLGHSHQNIKPSNIMLDAENCVFLGDSGLFPKVPLIDRDSVFDKECYDFSAPEQVQSLSISKSILATNTPSADSRGPGMTAGRKAVRKNTSSGCITSGAQRSPAESSSSTLTSPFEAKFPGSLEKYDPQKADVFSLGAIFLEILTFFLKRTSRNFASHRSAISKPQCRGGSLPDSSFHNNLGQVDSWIFILAKDASKKEDKLFRGIPRILFLIERMLSPVPENRPSAKQVQERIHGVLSEVCELSPEGVNGGMIHGIDTRASISSGMRSETTSVYGSTGIARSRGDGTSIATNTSLSMTSEGKSKTIGGSGSAGQAKSPKRTPKAWQAPVYAELSFG